MAPRGVAIPDVRARFFKAADAVLERDGPQGLTSRAVTAEAGTSTGLLFRHFADFETFVGDFVLDRLGHIHRVTASWVDMAGRRTVTENLASAALSLRPMAARVFDVVHSRPALVGRLVAHHHEHLGAGLEAIERSLARYLDAEIALGRVRPDADTGSIALALAASVHELSIRLGPSDEELDAHIRRVVTALVAQLVPPEPSPHG